MRRGKKIKIQHVWLHPPKLTALWGFEFNKEGVQALPKTLCSVACVCVCERESFFFFLLKKNQQSHPAGS